MTQYLERGSDTDVYDDEDITVLHELNKEKVFSIRFDEMRGAFFLTTEANLSVPETFDAETIPERIIARFNSMDDSLGVLMSGIQGSGKSLASRKVSISMRGIMPTIIINTAFKNTQDFISFINKLDSSVIIFDEFEKVFDMKQQAQLLTLFDGGVSSRHLFLFTANDYYRISQFMLNRPSRIHYHFKFEKLDESVVREYCARHLKDEKHLEDIVRVSKTSSKFSYDLLESIISEVNTFDQSVKECLNILNFSPEDNDSNYDMKLYDAKGNLVELCGWSKKHEDMSPFDFNFNIALQRSINTDDDDECAVVSSSEIHIAVNSEQMTRFDNGVYFYKVDDNRFPGHTYTLELEKPKKFWTSLI